MAQTENGMTFVKASVDFSTDDSAWTELDDFGAAVAVTTGARNAPEQHTFTGETPVVKGGARAASTIEVRFIYTEEATDPFEVVRAAFEAEGGECYVRYSPLGGDTGDFQYASGKSVMTDFVYPQGEAEGNEVILGGFTVKASSITKTAVS